MIADSGIDKIKLILNPFFLNDFEAKHIRPDNALTLHRVGNFVFLNIHAEYCNPLYNYRLTIASAIFELIQKKVIVLPLDNPVLTFMFICNHMEYFIMGISQLEFYFDFPKNKVEIEEDAIINGDIIQFNDKDGKPQECYYTNDYTRYERKSRFCVYNKRKKYLHDNHIKKSEIEKQNIEYRIEARLGRENCAYLNIDNLAGNYETIFKKFQSFLAVLFFTHLYNYITVKGKGNTYYTRLVRKAKEGKVKYYNRDRLKKSEPIETEPENGTARKQMQKMILGNYYRDVENERKATGMVENDGGIGGLEQR
jgi:hypothetical protein